MSHGFGFNNGNTSGAAGGSNRQIFTIYRGRERERERERVRGKGRRWDIKFGGLINVKKIF